MSIDTFKQNVIKFIDELYRQTNYEEFIISHIYIENKMDIKKLMDSCISQFDIFKKNIMNHNMDTLLQETFLNEYHSVLRKLWYSSLLDKQDKDIIWKWMILILYDIERYQIEREEQLKSSLIKKND